MTKQQVRALDDDDLQREEERDSQLSVVDPLPATRLGTLRPSTRKPRTKKAVKRR